MNFIKWEFEGKKRFKIIDENHNKIEAPYKETLSHFTYRMANAGIKKVTIYIEKMEKEGDVES